MRSCAIRKTSLLALLAALVASTPGCFTLYDDPEYPKKGKPAELHVFPTNISPWEDYRSALQPKFNLTADQALQQVLATTLRTEQSEIDYARFGVAAGLPGTSTSGSSSLEQILSSNSQVQADLSRQITTGEDGSTIVVNRGATGSAGQGLTTTNTNQSSTTLTPGVAPDLAAARGTPPTASLTGFGDQGVTTDPMMRYWVASALYQEVQILNRIVEDMTDHDEYKAYVVRMQVGLMPYSRKSPLDTYLTISASQKSQAIAQAKIKIESLETLPKAPVNDEQNDKNEADHHLDSEERESDSNENSDEAPSPGRVKDTDNASPQDTVGFIEDGYAALIQNTASLALNQYLPAAISKADREEISKNMDFAAATFATGVTADNEVELFPLLIADNLELTAHKRSARQVRDIALSLQAMVQNAGVAANANTYREIAQAALGQEYNNLLMVSKRDHNQLRVRLGALNSPTTRYAAVPRNHYITFLMLVKNKNSDSNKLVPNLNDVDISYSAEFRKSLNGEVYTWKNCQDCHKDPNESIPTCAGACLSLPPRAYELPTLDNLPDPEAPVNTASHNNPIFMADDGQKAVVTLIGGKHLDPKYIDIWVEGTTPLVAGRSATPASPGVTATRAVPSVPARDFRLHHLAMAVDSTGRKLTVVFPSLKKLGYVNKSDQPSSFDLVLVTDRRAIAIPSGTSDTPIRYNIDYRSVSASPAEKAASKLAVTGSVAVDSRGQGSVTINLVLDPADSELSLLVTNGRLPANVTQGDVAASGKITLPTSKDTKQQILMLEGLAPGQTLTLQLKNKNGKVSDAVQIPVVRIK